MLSKSGLGIVLSKLKQFDNPRVLYEQYSTDPEVAAEILWFAYMQGDIKKKVVADLGCGPGIFGVGALLLKAKKVFFIDKDEHAIKTTIQNLSVIEGKKRVSLIQEDVQNFSKHVNTVLQNPPFGTKIKHHDRIFLGKAFEIADVVYSLHKSTSKDFIRKFAKDNRFSITHELRFKMPLKRTMDFHKKPVYMVDVTCWRLTKDLNKERN